MRPAVFPVRLFPAAISIGLSLIFVLTGCAALSWGQSSNTAGTLAARIGAINREVQTAASATGVSQRLERLLEARSALLAELIGKDPSAALESALSSPIIEGLEIQRPGLIEARGQWEGTTEEAISDDFASGKSRTRWYLNTGQERVEIFLASESPRRTGMHIRVEGMRLGNRMAVSGVQETPVTAAATGTPLTCTTIGPQNVAVLMLTMPSNPTFPAAYTKASLQEAFFGSSGDTSNTQSLNGYWKEMSYGQTSATGQVFGPFALSQDYDYDTQAALETAAISAADSTVDFTQFTRIALIFPIQSWDGAGADDSLGCWSNASPSKGNFPASIGWLPAFPNSSPPVTTYVHELGHALGLGHSSTDDYGAVPLGPLGEAGTLTEYGDPFAVMATGVGQYVAQHKSLILHWLNPGDYQEVTSSGTFALEPLESTADPRGLRVLRDSLSSAWLWLEYRQPIGDADTALQNAYGNAPFNGALLHYEDPYLDSPYHSYLLDFHAVSAPNNFSQSALAPGSSWSDPDSLLTLSIGTPANGALPVTVSYDQACATLQYSATTFTASGGSGTITVSAPGSCSWSASTASSWISFTGVTSGSGNGTVPFSVAANSSSNQQNGYIAVQRQSTRIIEEGTRWTILSVSPSSGTGASGQFTFALYDANGYQDIYGLSINFSDVPACNVYVYPSYNELQLMGAQAASNPPAIFIGTPGSTASNSVCSILSSGSSITGSGNQLLVTVSINFFASFAGAHRVEAYTFDSGGNDSPTVPLGTWVVPSAQQPSITIQASAVGAPFSLDGGSVYTAPATFFWPSGAQHTITWLSTWTAQTGARYAFQNWADGGSNPRTITVPSVSTTYTANIQPQYQLSLAVTPAGAGTLTANPTSSDGYYNSGTPVQIQATPAAGFGLWYFSGGASGSTNPVSVTITSPLLVTGNFYCNPTPSSYLPNSTSSDSTTGLFDFSIGAGCAWSVASDSAWLTVSPTSGAGSATPQYSIAANSGAARTGTMTLTYNGSWTWPFTVNQDAAGSQRATVKSFSPTSGAGLSTVATAQFSALGGYGQVSYAVVTYYSADSTSYCQAELGQGSSGSAWVYLTDDLTSASSNLPASGTLSVSRCSLNLSSLTVSGSGNNLTLTLPFQFATAFVGKKRVLLEADTSGTSGWSSNQQMGTWTVVQAPTVSIDSPTSGSTISGTVTVSGWAIDNASAVGTAISSVKVLVDGTQVGTATYGVSRPDVCAAYPGRPGCPNVGFTYTLNTATLTPGSHTITVQATDSDSTPDTGSASVTVTVAATVIPSVFIDLPASGATVSGTVTVSGWAIDNTSTVGTAISSVKVLVDGTQVGTATYGVRRGDVCAAYPGRPGCPNVGYTYSLSTAALTAGSHTITVQATDSNATPDTGTASVTVTVAVAAAGPPSVFLDAPASGATVSGTVTVSGWAIDNTSAVGTAISSVQVLVDGTAVGTATYGSSRGDVCAAYPGRLGCPNVGYTYALNTAALTPGSHTITVKATDSDSTPDTGTANVTIIVAGAAVPPSVVIDAPATGATVSGTVTISGWAIDNTSTVGTAIGSVKVLVDGTAAGTATYGVSRPDVCAAYPGRLGCPNVGYTYSLNTATLTPGSHTITVTATDAGSTPDASSTSVTVIVAGAAVTPSVFIDAPASGASVSGTVTVSGWAIDNTSTVGTAIGSVKVLVDGTVVGTATYGINRSDVCAAYPGRLGCPNVGYTYSLNTASLTLGSHTITVTATDAGSIPDAASANVTVIVAAAPSVFIDSPASGATVSGTVTVSGWAIDNTSAVGTAISSVKVLVDGTQVGTATYGSSRPDVCAAYPGRPGCPNVGYAYSLNTATLTAGSHAITVKATDSDSSPDTGSATITVQK